MSLNNIILNHHLTSLLFSDHLCQIGEMVSDDGPVSISVKWKMSAGILWMVHEEQVDFLNEKETALLHKILQACKLDPDAIGLVNCFQYAADPYDIAKKLNASTLILSGVPENESKVPPHPAYEIFEWNKLKIIRTDSLEKIGTDQQLKVKLWNGLRQMFNL